MAPDLEQLMTRRHVLDECVRTRQCCDRSGYRVARFRGQLPPPLRQAGSTEDGQDYHGDSPAYSEW